MWAYENRDRHWLHTTTDQSFNDIKLTMDRAHLVKSGVEIIYRYNTGEREERILIKTKRAQKHHAKSEINYT